MSQLTPNELDSPWPQRTPPPPKRRLPWLKIALVVLALGGGLAGALAFRAWWNHPDQVLQRQMNKWADVVFAVEADAPESSTPYYIFRQLEDKLDRQPDMIERAWLKATEDRTLPRHRATRTAYIGLLIEMSYFGGQCEPDLAGALLNRITVRLNDSKTVHLDRLLDGVLASHGPRDLSVPGPRDEWYSWGESMELASEDGFELEMTNPDLIEYFEFLSTAK